LATNEADGMSIDIWEQLAAKEIPPVPADFDRDIHQRVNHALLVAHVAELGLRVLPYALVHMAQALIGLFSLTLSGRFPANSSTQDR
jgi:hypothetical protein